MNQQTNNNDYFIRKLVKTSGVKEAPPGFTDKLMGKIAQEEAKSSKLVTAKTWLLIAAGFVVLVALVFFVDWSFIGLDLRPESVDAQDYKKIVPLFQGFIDSFSSIFSFFTNSSIPAIVVVGILTLLLVDRLLKKFAPHRTYLV